MNKERREKSIAWLKEEIRSLELAPELNGCHMTPEWEDQLEIMRTCLEAVSAYYHDNISIDEAVESSQETLQRAMAEYKARAEKAERDAAVSDPETIMAYNSDTCQFCKNGQCYIRGGVKPCLPKWRGQKEE